MALNEMQLRKLSSLARPYPEGSLICAQGQASKEFFLLIKGEVEVIQDDVLLTTETEAGSFLGILAYFTESTRLATLRAKTECQIVVIDQQKIEPLMEKLPALAMRLAEGICQRFVSLETELRDLQSQADPLAGLLATGLPLLVCNLMNGQDQFFSGVYLTYLLKALAPYVDTQHVVISNDMIPPELSDGGYNQYMQRFVRDMRYRKEQLMQTRVDEDGPVTELPTPWETILGKIKFEV